MARYQLDPTDNAIIEMLREDGRAPLAKIGEAVELSADAIRVRLARLTADGIVRVIGIVHPSSLGYGALGTVVIDYDGPLQDLVDELRKHPEVTFMALMFGEYNVMCEIAARDDQALQDFVNNIIRQLDHVERVECWRTLEVVKWAVQGRPPPPHTAISNPQTHVEFDELDIRLLKVLTESPRLTYRELQDRVGAPYSVVRRRAQALFRAGVIVATAVVDVVTANPHIMAQICVQLGPGASQALDTLAADEQVHIIVRISGRYNALIELSCESHEHLAETIDRILHLEGIRSATSYVVTHYPILPVPWALAGHQRNGNGRHPEAGSSDASASPSAPQKAAVRTTARGAAAAQRRVSKPAKR